MAFSISSSVYTPSLCAYSQISSNRLDEKKYISRSFSSSFLSAKTIRLSHLPKTMKSLNAVSPIQCALVRKVNAKELDELLQMERKIPMVIDFYATWCGPCILLAQELEKLAVEYHGQVDFLKVDTDEEYQLATELEIRGLPTLVFVSNNREKFATKTEGLLPTETIKQIISDITV